MATYTQPVKNINLPLTEELLEAVDRVRGDVPRTVWIRRALELRLDLRNLTNDEIERLLDDWRAAAEGRMDDIDFQIAAKVAGERRST